MTSIISLLMITVLITFGSMLIFNKSEKRGKPSAPATTKNNFKIFLKALREQNIFEDLCFSSEVITTKPHCFYRFYRIQDGLKIVGGTFYPPRLKSHDLQREVSEIVKDLDERLLAYRQDLKKKEQNEAFIKECNRYPYCLSPNKQKRIIKAKEQIAYFNRKYEPVKKILIKS